MIFFRVIAILRISLHTFTSRLWNKCENVWKKLNAIIYFLRNVKEFPSQRKSLETQNGSILNDSYSATILGCMMKNSVLFRTQTIILDINTFYELTNTVNLCIFFYRHVVNVCTKENYRRYYISQWTLSWQLWMVGNTHLIFFKK